ncbi:uncharacterized protein LOC144630903 [Oculina patagonica]
MFSNTTFSPSHPNSTITDWSTNTALLTIAFANATFLAVLSPVAVAGNALILAVIWKKTFVRTPFHILLSGLAFTDLCTGLIAQPFYAAATLMYVANSRVEQVLYITLNTTGNSSAIYFISLTVLLITLMSIERWLHMSRRFLVTSRCGYLTVIILLIIPIPAVVYRVLVNENEIYTGNIYIMTIILMFSCYLITSFAYFKVCRIIRHHQQQVQANETSQNFGRQAIDLAKYKKSVASMLYIILLFSLCFLPFIVSAGLYVNVPITFETVVALRMSSVLLFLSSSLNPGLYVWRMNDIRNGVKQLFSKNG